VDIAVLRLAAAEESQQITQSLTKFRESTGVLLFPESFREGRVVVNYETARALKYRQKLSTVTVNR